jgi:hypothetical protein
MIRFRLVSAAYLAHLQSAADIARADHTALGDRYLGLQAANTELAAQRDQARAIAVDLEQQLAAATEATR